MIWNMPTGAELSGPQPPFIVEVLVTNHHAGRANWVIQQSVRSLADGLIVASRINPAYRCRLNLGRPWGHLYLKWPEGEGLLGPEWSRDE